MPLLLCRYESCRLDHTEGGEFLRDLFSVDAGIPDFFFAMVYVDGGSSAAIKRSFQYMQNFKCLIYES